MKTHLFLLALLALSQAKVPLVRDEEPADDQPIDEKAFGEKGLWYTVPQTIDQVRNLFSGFLVGFYHDPTKALDEQCLDLSQEKDVGFLLD